MSLVIVMLYHIPQGGPQLTPRNGEIQTTFPRLVHVFLTNARKSLTVKRCGSLSLPVLIINKESDLKFAIDIQSSLLSRRSTHQSPSLVCSPLPHHQSALFSLTSLLSLAFVVEQSITNAHSAIRRISLC
jgi:hypothetical protein